MTAVNCSRASRWEADSCWVGSVVPDESDMVTGGCYSSSTLLLLLLAWGEALYVDQSVGVSVGV